MPRQLNFIVIGVSLFSPFAIAAVSVSRQKYRDAGHAIVCNSWGDIPEAEISVRVESYADWYESSTVAFVSPPDCLLLPSVDPQSLWSTATVSESDARSAIGGSSRTSDTELIRCCGRLSYSSGRGHYTWSDAVTGTKAAMWSQAIAAGAAAWFGREVVRGLGRKRQNRTATRKEDRAGCR